MAATGLVMVRAAHTRDPTPGLPQKAWEKHAPTTQPQQQRPFLMEGELTGTKKSKEPKLPLLLDFSCTLLR